MDKWFLDLDAEMKTLLYAAAAISDRTRLSIFVKKEKEEETKRKKNLLIYKLRRFGYSDTQEEETPIDVLATKLKEYEKKEDLLMELGKFKSWVFDMETPFDIIVAELNKYRIEEYEKKKNLLMKLVELEKKGVLIREFSMDDTLEDIKDEYYSKKRKETKFFR